MTAPSHPPAFPQVKAFFAGPGCCTSPVVYANHMHMAYAQPVGLGYAYGIHHCRREVC